MNAFIGVLFLAIVSSSTKAAVANVDPPLVSSNVSNFLNPDDISDTIYIIEIEESTTDDEPDAQRSQPFQSMSLEELIESGAKNQENLEYIAIIMMLKFRINQQIISIDNVENAQKISFDKEIDTICIDNFELAMKFVEHFGEWITKMELKINKLRQGTEALVRNYRNLKTFYSVYPDDVTFPLAQQIFMQNPQIQMLELRNYRSLDEFKLISKRLQHLHTIFFEIHADLFDDGVAPIRFDTVKHLHLIIMLDVPKFFLTYFPFIFDQLESLSICDYWNNEFDWIDAISRNRTLDQITIFETPSDFYLNLRNLTQL